jgi:hypothetical protein
MWVRSGARSSAFRVGKLCSEKFRWGHSKDFEADTLGFGEGAPPTARARVKSCNANQVGQVGESPGAAPRDPTSATVRDLDLNSTFSQELQEEGRRKGELPWPTNLIKSTGSLIRDHHRSSPCETHPQLRALSRYNLHHLSPTASAHRSIRTRNRSRLFGNEHGTWRTYRR